MPKTVIVLPAYNAAKTLRQTLRDIPTQLQGNVLLVDDASSDGTAALARTLGIPVYKHAANMGYGANQKTCYQLALRTDAEIIAMLHPDYQYDPKLLPLFIDLIGNNYFDVVLGTRIRSRSETLAHGMPRYKYYANRALTLYENIVTGQNLSEWHTGMRVFRRHVLETIPLKKNSNNFVFDTQVLFQAVAHGFKIGEISVPVRYFPEASSIGVQSSLVYGLHTAYIATKYLFTKKVA